MEWPRENQKPTFVAGRPSATRRRVVLSIAAMWSASKACRAPRVNAVMPTATPKTCPCAPPSSSCAGPTSRKRLPHPRTCSARTAREARTMLRRSAALRVCRRAPRGEAAAVVVLTVRW
ncbi:hypothetical protein [Ornithinimicrobium kibberense]|uniref:hypothetical protein n=1 Tax=Ornithinimicrobium kibberense TaxID=282060 RepID=UPI003617AC6A